MLTTMVRTRACRPPLAARAVALLGEYRGECPLLLELLAAFAAQAPGATTAAQTRATNAQLAAMISKLQSEIDTLKAYLAEQERSDELDKAAAR